MNILLEKDAKIVLERTHQALLQSEFCHYSHKGVKAISADEMDNWCARMTISRLQRVDNDKI